MITGSKGVDSSTKDEGAATDGKLAEASNSSTPWFRLKDPRIVRVSRAFGGKDRHSKVCTIRGLRDRRVRLSVPTAIQLYDLQERLGLNQPSKAIDWLLNAAKDEIDELPPLPIPPGNFPLNPRPLLSSSLGVNDISDSNKEGLKLSTNVDWHDPGALRQTHFWSSDAFLRGKSKEVARDSADEKHDWTGRNEEGKEDSNVEHQGAQVSSSSNILHRGSHDSSTQGLVNAAVPSGSFLHLENPNFQLSSIGSNQFSSQTADLHSLNSIPLQSTLSLLSGSPVLARSPAGMSTQSYFPSHVAAAAAPLGIDPRQISQFQMFAPSTQKTLPNSLTPTSPFSMRPFPFGVTPPIRPVLLHPHNGVSHSDEEREFPLK